MLLTTSFKPPVPFPAEHPALSSDETQVNMQWTAKTPQIDAYWCYIIGYLEVTKAGLATDFSSAELEEDFDRNYHRSVLKRQKPRLVLVKGGRRSPSSKKAVLISARGKDTKGRPLKILSPEMRKIFGDFDGHVSTQRSPPRWVKTGFVLRAAEFVRSLG